MSRKNNKRKLISYSVIWAVLLSSFLIYSPNNIVLSAEGDPYIEIISPSEELVFDEKMVEFTGKISDDTTTSDKLKLSVYEEQGSPTKTVEISNDVNLSITPTGDYGEWSFTKEFSEGNHTISFVVEDEEGNSTAKSFAFTIKEPLNESPVIVPSSENAVTENIIEGIGIRPYVEEILLMAYDKQPVVEKYAPANHYGNTVETDDEPSDVNYLPGEDLTQVRLNTRIQVIIKETGELVNLTEPLYVVSSNGDPVTMTSEVEVDSTNGQYKITLTPNEDLIAGTTYSAYINTGIKNNLGLGIIPKSLKFTTRPMKHSEDVHGGYRNNTNSCANCHSTHNGNDATLIGGKYGDESQGVCMACHDGTAGTPMVDMIDEDNQHFKMHEVTLDEGNSCASCHNPHTAWTKDIPATADSPAVKGNPNKIKEHNVNSYKKAPGTSTDFTLCTRCHTDGKASNIEKFYKDEAIVASSGHNFSFTNGNYTVNGQMPCADCHETHGSSKVDVRNIFSLKQNLGHTKPDAAAEKFATGTEWTPDVERKFCTKCHNNSTDMYGKTATFNEAILGHLQLNPENINDPVNACSSCHSNSIIADEKVRSTVHAPKKLTTTP